VPDIFISVENIKIYEQDCFCVQILFNLVNLYSCTFDVDQSGLLYFLLECNHCNVCRKVPYDLVISPLSKRDGCLKVPIVAKMLVLFLSQGSVLTVLTLFIFGWAILIIQFVLCVQPQGHM